MARKQIVDGDGGFGAGDRGDRLAALVDSTAPVPGIGWVPKSLKDIVFQVQNPVLLDLGPAVEPCLELAIMELRQVGDFNHEDGLRWVAVHIVLRFAGNDGKVRLGHGAATEDEWKERAHVKSWGEDLLQSDQALVESYRMGRALRLVHLIDDAVDKLDPRIAKNTGIGDPQVLLASPGAD